MTAFLISYTDFAEDLQVQTFATFKDASAYSIDTLAPHRTAKIVSDEFDMADRQQFSAALLIKIYNAFSDKPVTKFETNAVAARRTFAAIQTKFGNVPVTAVEATAESPDADTSADDDDATDKGDKGNKGATEPTPHPDHGVSSVADKKAEQAAIRAAEKEVEKAAKAEAAAKKAADKAEKAAAAFSASFSKAEAAAKKAADKAAKAAAQPAKVPGGKAAAGQDPVPSKFKSVREGTFRAALLRAMDGTKTVAEIAAESGKAASLVLSHAFCLTRDCGIGYSTKDGKLTVVFPEGKTIADAIAPVKSAA